MNAPSVVRLIGSASPTAASLSRRDPFTVASHCAVSRLGGVPVTSAFRSSSTLNLMASACRNGIFPSRRVGLPPSRATNWISRRPLGWEVMLAISDYRERGGQVPRSSRTGKGFRPGFAVTGVDGSTINAVLEQGEHQVAEGEHFGAVPCIALQVLQSGGAFLEQVDEGRSRFGWTAINEALRGPGPVKVRLTIFCGRFAGRTGAHAGIRCKLRLSVLPSVAGRL